MISGKAALTILHSLKHRGVLLTICVIMTLALLVLLNVMIVRGANQLECTHEGKSVSDLPCGHVGQIDISPLVPVAGDVVTITSSGTWCDSCVPKYQSHQVMDNVIRIDAVANPPGYACAAVVTPWAFSVEITPTLTGIYTVEVYIACWGAPPLLRGSTSFNVVPAPTSTVLSTDGGELTYHYPGHITSLVVPPGALSIPSVFTISYHIPPTTTDQLQGMNHFFDLAGTQIMFTIPLTLTVHYSESARGAIISGTENLYRWQSGRWVTDNITLTDRRSGGLSAQITHLSLFGVLGETNRTYLPIVLKYK